MTTATLSAAQAVHRERLFLRRWLPQSRHYREKWSAWRRDCEHLAGTPNPRERVCRHCGRVNKTGEAASAFLHWACYQALEVIDARELQREAAPPDLGGNGKRRSPLSPESNGMALLTALLGLPQPMTMAQIVRAAWHADPRRFGLEGDPWLPCSARVRNTLYGPCGLISRGYVAVEADGYVVTPAGRALAGKGTQKQFPACAGATTDANGGPHP